MQSLLLLHLLDFVSFLLCNLDPSDPLLLNQFVLLLLLLKSVPRRRVHPLLDASAVPVLFTLKQSSDVGSMTLFHVSEDSGSSCPHALLLGCARCKAVLDTGHQLCNSWIPRLVVDVAWSEIKSISV